MSELERLLRRPKKGRTWGLALLGLVAALGLGYAAWLRWGKAEDLALSTPPQYLLALRQEAQGDTLPGPYSLPTWLEDWIRPQRAVYSLHATGQQSTAWLGVYSGQEPDSWEEVLQEKALKHSLRVRRHMGFGHPWYEITTSEGTFWALTAWKDQWLLAQSAIPIERALRWLSGSWEIDSYQAPGEAELSLNLARWAEGEQAPELRLALQSIPHVELNPDGNTFRQGSPAPPSERSRELAWLVPNSTARIASFHFPADTPIGEVLKKQGWTWDQDTPFTSIRGEVWSYLLLEPQNGLPEDWLALVHDPIRSDLGGDTVEGASGFLIRQLPGPHALEPLQRGHTTCYYLRRKDWVVASSTLTGLKRWLAEVGQQSVWATQKGPMLDQLLADAPVKHIVHGKRGGQGLSTRLRPYLSWKYPAWASALRWEGWQSELSARQPSFFWQWEASDASAGPKEEKLYSTALRYPPQAGPFPVRNAEDRAIEVLVQDTASDVRLLDKKGRVVFTLYLEETLLDAAAAPTGFWLLTERRLLAVDRDGKITQETALPEAERRPWSTAFLLAQKEVCFVAEQDGRLASLGPGGAWEDVTLPVSPAQALAARPTLVTLGNKTLLAWATRERKLFVTDGQGQLQAGFPLLLPSRPAGALFSRPAADTLLYALGEEGKLWTLGKKGTLLSERSYLKVRGAQSFQLVAEASGKSFVALAQSADSLYLYPPGQTRVRWAWPQSTGDYQYYQFGASGGEVLLTWQNGRVTATNGQGQLLWWSGATSQTRPRLLYSDNAQAWFLLRTDNNRVEMVAFSN